MPTREPNTVLDRVMRSALHLNRRRAETLVEMMPRPLDQVKLTEAEQMQRYEALTGKAIGQMYAEKGEAETEHYLAIMKRRQLEESRWPVEMRRQGYA